VNVRSIPAILRGAAVTVRDPRLLARLPRLRRGDAREQSIRTTVHSALGGPPRTVPIEVLLRPGPHRLPPLSLLDDASPILDLVLLQSLVARFSACRFFEVGTFRGESAAAVADIAEEVVTLSLPDDLIRQSAGDASVADAVRSFSEGHPRIRHLYGDSRSFDLTEFAGWADVIFIDGDHTRETVASDTRRWWPVRRTEQSIVVWHDGFVTPLSPRWEVLAGIADGLPPEYRGGLVHVSNTLCVAWLPDASELPSLPRSYVPRTAFSVEVALLPNWHSARGGRHPAAGR
jgi:hypothetical protein